MIQYNNGNNKIFPIDLEEKEPNEVFSNNILYDNNEKKVKGDILLEDILEKEEIFDNLRTKKGSSYLKLITLKNIIKLIQYCLYPNSILKKEEKKYLRYPYYSCLLLCSDIILFFSKSINHIKNSSSETIKKENEENKIEKIKENVIDNSDSLPEQKNEVKNIDYINQQTSNLTSEDIFDNINSNMYNFDEEEKNFDDEFYNYKNDYEENEKYVQISETEIKIDTIHRKTINEYDEEERRIINDILNEIVKFLDFQ